MNRPSNRWGHVWLFSLTLGAAFQLSCAEAVSPGSDLTDPAPPAVLGSPPPLEVPIPEPTSPTEEGVVGTLDGEYTVEGSLTNPLGPPIAVELLAVVDQGGTTEEDDAWVLIEVRSTEGDTPPARFESPAAINAGGRFSGTVVDLMMPGDFSDLLTDDVNTDLVFDARIVSDDCFEGALGLQLKEAQVEGIDNPISIRLDGTFTAAKTGTACDREDAPSEDAATTSDEADEEMTP